MGDPAKDRPPGQPGLRWAEWLGALSLATDLANGWTPEHGLRVALLAFGAPASALTPSSLARTWSARHSTAAS